MARVITQKWVREWKPLDKTVTETTPLFAIPAGWRALSSSVRILIASVTGTQTLSLGDSGDVDRLMKTGDPTITTLGLYDGTTAAGLLVSGGYLYTTATTIDVVYTADGTATVSVVARFTITVRREEP